jgi:hypothetical protein
MHSEELRRYLDGVEGNLQGPGKRDVLREIESHLYDRAEALAAARGEAPGPEDFRRAMEELGDPSELAVSYSGERNLVTPKEYAAYWYLVLLVFAVHLTMLFLAVVTRTRFNFFPFNVLPPKAMEAPAETFLLASLGVQAFLFDAGLVLMAFFLLRKTIRRVELPNLTFRVETGRRASLFRAAFALALGVCLGVANVRDNFFSVKLPPGGTEGIHTLFLPPFNHALPYILAFLSLAFVKDILYAFLGERTATVAVDLATWIGGVALCVLLFARDPIAGLPGDFPLDDVRLTVFNSVMARLLGFFFIVMAAIFAARAVKRFLRLLQLWGEQDAVRT